MSESMNLDEWRHLLEIEMTRIQLELEKLIEQDTAQDNPALQRMYLHRANAALRDGLAWFAYFKAVVACA